VIFSYPLALDAPVSIAIPFGVEKLEWCCYLTVEQFFEDMFSGVDKMPAFGGRTDRHLATA